MEKAFLEYRQLLEDLDQAMQFVTTLYAGQLRCGPGCVSCCKEFSLLPVEAAVVEAALRMLPKAVRKGIPETGRASGSCPFLKGGLCVVYNHRPIICRTQGLPIGYVDEERECVEISACLLNFPEEMEIDPDKLLFLDPFNARLREVNKCFLTARNFAPETPRISMEIVAAGGINFQVVFSSAFR